MPKKAQVKFKNIPKKTRVAKTSSREKIVFERKKDSPSIPRFITEFGFPRIFSFSVSGKIFSVSIIAIMILILIVAGHLLYTLKQIKDNADTTKDIVNNAAYWQNIERTYPNYRDSYYQLAILAYEVGDTAKAQGYLSQTEAIDPNYPGIGQLKSLLK